MKYITVPPLITMRNLVNREAVAVDGDIEPWSFCKYLCAVVLPDTAMGKGYAADKARFTLDDLFKCSKPGDEVGVEDEHYKLLKKTVEEPTLQAAPAITMQCLPFQEAVLEAKDQPLLVEFRV